MTACVEHPGARDRDGYGRVNVRLFGRRVALAHRAAYEKATGAPIPSSMTIDHLCRNRACVNVAHMQVVDRATNTLRGIGPTAENARKTMCQNGHPLSGDNLYERPDGGRACRACNLEAVRRYQAKGVPA